MVSAIEDSYWRYPRMVDYSFGMGPVRVRVVSMSNIALRRSKTDYSYDWGDEYWAAQIALLNEYVKHDDGADGRELCTKSLCLKMEGHDDTCIGPAG